MTATPARWFGNEYSVWAAWSAALNAPSQSKCNLEDPCRPREAWVRRRKTILGKRSRYLLAPGGSLTRLTRTRGRLFQARASVDVGASDAWPPLTPPCACVSCSVPARAVRSHCPRPTLARPPCGATRARWSAVVRRARRVRPTRRRTAEAIWSRFLLPLLPFWVDRASLARIPALVANLRTLLGGEPGQLLLSGLGHSVSSRAWWRDER